MNARQDRRAHAAVLRWALVAAAAAGCASSANLAPPVDPAMIEAGRTAGVDAQSLQRGRQVYLGACARCHSPVAVQSRTPQQWERILHRMEPLSGLNDSDRAALRAYLEQAAAIPAEEAAAPAPRP